MPSLWHHQVINLEDTISINHNWFNASNIDTVYSVLCGALRDVEAELADIRAEMKEEEWVRTCQKVLKANHGMNFDDFLNMIVGVARRRADVIDRKRTFIFDNARLGVGQAIFDLNQIKRILKAADGDFHRNCVHADVEAICKEFTHLSSTSQSN